MTDNTTSNPQCSVSDLLASVFDSHPSVKRIAIFRALFLGDLLCAVPAFRLLRTAFPDAEITLIGLPWAAELVKRLPYIDRLRAFPGYPGIKEVPYSPSRTRTFLNEQRHYHYDLAIQMHGDGTISNSFVANLGASRTLGYCRGADQRLALLLPYQNQEHEIARWVRLVRSIYPASYSTTELDSTTSDPQTALYLEFPTTVAERQQAARLLSNTSRQTGPLIGIHPGAKDPARRWPTACFAALADALIERYDARIVLTGNADESPITVEIREMMQHPSVDLAGATNLGTFAALIAQLDLLITNDTGASHLAAATTTPSVVLFGPSRPEQWAPLDQSRHHIIDAIALVEPAHQPAALQHLAVVPVLATCAQALSMADSHRSLPLGRI